MMATKSKWIVALLLVGLLASLAPPPPAAAAGFGISISPKSGPNRTTVAVSSSNAPAYAPINIVVGKKDGTGGQLVATTTSDSRGRFQMSFVLGRTTAYDSGSLIGVWAVANPGTGSRSTSNIAVFTVSFGLAISPNSGPVKTRVTVSSSDAPAGSRITVFVGSADGGSGTAVSTVRADSHGDFQTSFTIGDVGALQPGTDVGIFARAEVDSRTVPSVVKVFRLIRTVRRPGFTSLTPGQSTTVGAGWRQFGATISSDANITEIILYINGERVTPSLNWQAGNKVTALASKDLSPGGYTVTMQAKDADGDNSFAQWDFTVGAAGESQWFASNGAVKSASFNATVRSLVEAYRYHLYGQSWDGGRHNELPTHIATLTNAAPLRTWSPQDGSFDQQYTTSTLRSLVEAFRWHLYGMTWEPGSRPAMVTHASGLRGPDPIQPWFDSSGRPFKGNMEATLTSLVQAMRWHFWGYTWDGSRHPDIPTHAH